MIATSYSVIISFKGDFPGHVGASMFAVIIACMGIYPVQPVGSSVSIFRCYFLPLPSNFSAAVLLVSEL